MSRLVGLGPGRVLAGVDGVDGADGADGAGKTTLADRLAERVRGAGRPVVRSSVDGFHRPAEQRYRLGRGSPQGYYPESYDLDALRTYLLDPCSPGGSGCTATPSSTPRATSRWPAPPRSLPRTRL